MIEDRKNRQKKSKLLRPGVEINTEGLDDGNAWCPWCRKSFVMGGLIKKMPRSCHLCGTDQS